MLHRSQRGEAERAAIEADVPGIDFNDQFVHPRVAGHAVEAVHQSIEHTSPLDAPLEGEPPDLAQPVAFLPQLRDRRAMGVLHQQPA
jgi:hypothetical protein